MKFIKTQGDSFQETSPEIKHLKKFFPFLCPYPLLSLQLRESVFQFSQKELAPKAAEIDKNNEFKELKVCNKPVLLYKYISIKLL